MELRRLGTSGLRVSALSLGAMTFGAEADEDTSRELLDAFVAAGGTLIDTADVYCDGESEAIIGRWLANRGRPRDLVIATKGRFPMSTGPADVGASRRHLLRACEQSLARLGVDSVDLYQLHGWDPSTPIEETLDALDEIVRRGWASYVGVSNYTGWQLQRALLTARFRGTAPIVSLQPLYNLLSREIEWELLPQCIEEGVGVLPWSPLGGGWLTGKYRARDAPKGSTRLGEDPTRGVEARALRDNPTTWAVLKEVEAIAAELGASTAQVALAWVRERPGVSSVIVGARTVEQLRDNLASQHLHLDRDQMRRLTEVSAPGVAIYPQAFIEKYCGYDGWRELGTRTELPPIGD
jgi:aryl-alcohol dehydrogenase-like predicted oxidoreductase